MRHRHRTCLIYTPSPQTCTKVPDLLLPLPQGGDRERRERAKGNRQRCNDLESRRDESSFPAISGFRPDMHPRHALESRTMPFVAGVSVTCAGLHKPQITSKLNLIGLIVSLHKLQELSLVAQHSMSPELVCTWNGPCRRVQSCSPSVGAKAQMQNVAPLPEPNSLLRTKVCSYSALRCHRATRLLAQQSGGHS